MGSSTRGYTRMPPCSLGLAYVFDQMPQLDRDLVDVEFVPKGLKLPKPAPAPESPNSLLAVSPVAKRVRPASMCNCSRRVIAGRIAVPIANCFEYDPCHT